MLDDEILLLAQQFLDGPEGKALLERLNIDFDTASINQKIKDLENRPDRETRQQNREDKRQRRRDEREKRRAQRKDARKEEILKLRAQIKANIPVIKEFPITGRVYWLLDKDDPEPNYSGVKINVLKGALVKKENETQIPESQLQTQPNGTFDIKIKTAVLPAKVTIKAGEDEEGNDIEREFEFRPNDIVIVRPQLVFRGGDVGGGIPPTLKEITTLDNVIKSDLGVTQLLTVNQQLKQTVNDAQLAIDEETSKLGPLYYSGPENALISRKGLILELNNVIKTRLIPLIVGLLISFGITKISQSAFKICPTPERLRENVRRRNRVVRQLNQAFVTLSVNIALAAIFKLLSVALKRVAFTLRNTPLPLATQPYNTVGQLQEVEEQITLLSEGNDDLNRETIIALVLLATGITTVLVLLNTLDKLTEECAGELDLEFEPINQELQDLTAEQAEEGFPLVTEVNGFTMGIELEKNTVGSLKRRYAIAKNKQGIVQLKGEPSFSATDQILIDELAFYITTNNLKAF